MIFLSTGVLLLAVLFWLDIYTRHGDAIVVPDLRGLQVDDVLPILDRSGLRYEIIDSVYTKNVAPGAIVEQIPIAESKVKESRIIFLTVNAHSTRVVPMPDIQDLSQRQAVAVLNSVGFTADEVKYVACEYRDLVLGALYNGREVSVGEKLPEGSRLIVLVGNGMGEEPVDSTTTDVPETEQGEIENDWFE